MYESVVIGGKKVPLSFQARVIASKMSIGRNELGQRLEKSPRIVRQNGTLTRVNVDDVRSVVSGKEEMRAPQRYFIGKIFELNLHEGWCKNLCVQQLQVHIDDTLFVLPRKEERQPPFLGHPLQYSVTKVVKPEKEGEIFVVFVKFYRLRKATAADLNPPIE